MALPLAITPWAAPLYGGGYWVALAQACLVYYLLAVVLHWVVPALLPVRSIQPGKRRSGQVTQEALNSLGAQGMGRDGCRLRCSGAQGRVAPPRLTAARFRPAPRLSSAAGCESLHVDHSRAHVCGRPGQAVWRHACHCVGGEASCLPHCCSCKHWCPSSHTAVQLPPYSEAWP